VLKIMLDVVSGVSFLHSWKAGEGNLHRDLKTDNILLHSDQNNNLVAKIGDFGMACDMGDKVCPGEHDIGTFWYRSPELRDDEPHGRPTDVSF
jgi:serine/threonine protein kinase